MMLEARVKTNQPGFSIKMTGLGIEIRVKSAPQDGKANTEIVKELRRLTGKDARILSGLKSKKKVIEIAGINGQELEALYESCH